MCLPSSFDLPSDADANTTLYLSALRSDGENVKRAEEHRLWISLNEFSARLTKANISDWTHNATFLCDDLLENPEFAVALSAAAQTHASRRFKRLYYLQDATVIIGGQAY